VAWFLTQSFLIILLAFALGMVVGWLWWGQPWRKVPFTESQAVQTVAQRLEDLIADRDAEIARLRERTLPDGSFPVESLPDTETDGTIVPTVPTDTDGTSQTPQDLPEADTPEADRPEAATETQPPDDLKRIEGIGPRISTALNEAGIATYHALAQADEEQLRGALREAGLTFAPSLVTWSRQAAMLAGGDEEGFQEFTSEMMRRPRHPSAQSPQENPERTPAETTAATAPETDQDPPDDIAEDDLERVEGIGPRISKALRAAGIHTYRNLADSDVPALKNALENAGLRFAPSLPTWPRQAAFLADEDEDGFEAFTNTLVGGRDSGRKA
jgi:predicted flap endonuclease-1-like 5' DNA nuclease